MHEEVVEDLTSLGFTEYEARVYLALLALNPATGYQLSKESGVPRSMVYEALGRLEARGAVLRTEERRATLYRPVPPEVLLDRYQSEQAQRLRRLREGLQGIFASLDRDRIWSITGRESILSYASQMIRDSQEELFLVLPDGDLDRLRGDVQAACDRGLAVHTLLTGEGELECGEVASHPPAESEAQELTDMLVVVADNSAALIASASAHPMAAITSNRNLVWIVRQFVWMELFAQRVVGSMGPDLLAKVAPQDREILQTFASQSPPRG